MSYRSILIHIGWLRALLFVGINILANEAFFTLAYIVLEDLGVDTYTLSEDSSQLPILLLMIFLQGTVVIGLVWIFRRYIDRQPMKTLGISVKGRLKDFLWGFLTGGLIMGTGFLILWRMGYLEIVRFQFRPGVLLGHFLLFSLVAIQEEVANRGYILSNFLDSMPKYPALLCSAIIFAVLHAFNPNLSEIGFVNIILGGILMGLFYVYRRNLWFPIGLHLSWNFVQGPILGFPISGQSLGKTTMVIHKHVEPEWISGGNFGFEGSAVACGLVIMAIFILWNRVRNSIP